MDSTLMATLIATQPAKEPELSIEHRERIGPDPRVAAALGVLVGLIVLVVLYRIRRTFGMK